MNNIRSLVVWMGTCCTLKCRNCCNWIPYIGNNKYGGQAIVDDLKYITESVHIGTVQLQGGEPFLYTDLDVVIKYVARNSNIDNIEIATNGTVVPTDEMCEVIKSIGDKIIVRISEYECVAESKRLELIKKLKNYQINYSMYNFAFGNGEWFDSGEPNREAVTDKDEVWNTYYKCLNQHCWTLADHKMVCCGKIIALMELRHEKEEENNVIALNDIHKKTVKFSERLEEFDNHYKGSAPIACRWCKSVHGRVPAALQLD